MTDSASSRFVGDDPAKLWAPMLISARCWYFRLRYVAFAFFAVGAEVATWGLVVWWIRAGEATGALIFSGIGAALTFGVVWYAVGDFRDYGHQIWDAGDRLMVVRGSQRVEIFLSNISYVGFARSRYDPPHVQLMLRKPCELGGFIKFIPRGVWLFREPQIVSELQYRIGKILGVDVLW